MKKPWLLHLRYLISILTHHFPNFKEIYDCHSCGDENRPVSWVKKLIWPRTFCEFSMRKPCGVYAVAAMCRSCDIPRVRWTCQDTWKEKSPCYVTKKLVTWSDWHPVIISTVLLSQGCTPDPFWESELRQLWAGWCTAGQRIAPNVYSTR